MAVSSREIEDIHFNTSLRGYDREEVDLFMAECAQHTGTLEERTRIAEVQSAAIATELAEMKTSIDVLLQEATDARRTIIEEARAEAKAIVSSRPPVDGTIELSGLELSTAVPEAADMERQAEESAERIRADADRILIDARQKADAILEEANASRAAMESQLAEIRQILRAARTDDLPREATSNDAASNDTVSGDAGSEVVIDLRDVADEPTNHHMTS